MCILRICVNFMGIFNFSVDILRIFCVAVCDSARGYIDVGGVVGICGGFTANVGLFAHTIATALM